MTVTEAQGRFAVVRIHIIDDSDIAAADFLSGNSVANRAGGAPWTVDHGCGRSPTHLPRWSPRGRRR
jgi:hypothetical protein